MFIHTYIHTYIDVSVLTSDTAQNAQLVFSHDCILRREKDQNGESCIKNKGFGGLSYGL